MVIRHPVPVKSVYRMLAVSRTAILRSLGILFQNCSHSNIHYRIVFTTGAYATRARGLAKMDT